MKKVDEINSIPKSKLRVEPEVLRGMGTPQQRLKSPLPLGERVRVRGDQVPRGGIPRIECNKFYYVCINCLPGNERYNPADRGQKIFILLCFLNLIINNCYYKIEGV